MAPEGSVTGWLGPLKEGDARAVQELWERYFQRLVVLARRQLQHVRPRAADEEDVALSAFESFCRAAEQGRFPALQNRDNLWRLLMTLTLRKAAHLVRDEHRQKRHAQRISLSARDEDRDEAAGLANLIGREPTPEFAAQVAEECQVLLTQLGDQELAQVALWKLEGYTNEEIAAKMDCTPRTIERKIRIIRGRWEEGER